MKKFNAFFTLLIISTILLSTPIEAQPPFDCQWDPSGSNSSTEQLSGGGTTNLNCVPTVSFDDYKLTSPFTIYVNFHFYEDYTVVEGTEIVNSLMGWINDHYLDNIAECWTPGPNGVIPAHVPDGKFRIKLYSENENTDDLYGGIWFHELQTSASNNPYPGRVLNIYLRSGNCSSGWSCTGCNVNMRGFSPGTDCSDPSNAGRFSRSAKGILHEIGHHLDLDHTNWCQNQCNTVDIDPVAECATPCPNSGVLCDNTISTNPGTAFCPDNMTVDTICTWSTSNNIMTQGVDQKCLTPCQWEVVFNRVANRQNDRRYSWADGCTEKAETHYLEEGSNVIWQNLMLLNRDIVVTKGSTLTINCEVRLSAECKFIVQRGGKLIVDGGKITNLCPDTRWRGIYVHGNGNREQPEPFGTQAPDDAGILIVQNGSVIERAANAITTKGEGAYGGYDYFGGVVYAEGSEFVNNRRVAEFMKYDFPNKSQFIDCTINKTSDWTINAIGITIWDGVVA